jgi:GST-like protein
MHPVTDHPISKSWPAQSPDLLQLYSLPTPNGVKISIALEEMAIPYEAHLVDFATSDQMTRNFLRSARTTKSPQSGTRTGQKALWPFLKAGQS